MEFGSVTLNHCSKNASGLLNPYARSKINPGVVFGEFRISQRNHGGHYSCMTEFKNKPRGGTVVGSRSGRFRVLVAV